MSMMEVIRQHVHRLRHRSPRTEIRALRCALALVLAVLLYHACIGSAYAATATLYPNAERSLPAGITAIGCSAPNRHLCIDDTSDTDRLDFAPNATSNNDFELDSVSDVQTVTSLRFTLRHQCYYDASDPPRVALLDAGGSVLVGPLNANTAIDDSTWYAWTSSAQAVSLSQAQLDGAALRIISVGCDEGDSYVTVSSASVQITYTPVPPPNPLDDTSFPLRTDRSSLGASTAAWDEKQGVLRQNRAHSAARFLVDPTVQRTAGGTSDYCGWSIEVGDFNDDGLEDVLQGCAQNAAVPGRAVVHLRTGDATFGTPIDLPNPAGGNDNCGHSVDVGDINRDGRDDVLMSCIFESSNRGSFVVFTSNGPGFNSGVEYVETIVSSQCGIGMAVGDFDGMNGPDVAMGCPVDAGNRHGRVVVHFNDGSGGLATSVTLANPTPVVDDQCGWGVAAGDVNADGRDDIFVGCKFDDTDETGNVIVFRRNAANTGFDVDSETFPPVSGADYDCGAHVDAADFNGDGRDDMAYSCAGDDTEGNLAGSVVVHLRHASSDSFLPGTVLTHPDQVASNMCGEWNGLDTGDLSGDGLPDVVMGCGDASTHAASSGAAYAFVTSAAGVPGATSYPIQRDIMAANTRCGYGMAIGADGTGDGRGDVIIGCPFFNGNRGASTVTDATSDERSIANPTPASNERCGAAVAHGDVNGDGLVDLVTGCHGVSTSQGRVAVHVRNAANTGYLAGVELAHPAPVNSDECGRSVAVGDVNADGRDDILAGCIYDDTGGSASGSVILWQRDAANVGFDTGVEYANPTPQANAACGAALTGPDGAAMGDINGDGRADLVYGCSGQTVSGNSLSGAVVVRLRNTTNNGFDTPIALPNPTPAANELCGVSVAVGDLDGDGYADVAAGCPGTGSGTGSVVHWTWDGVSAFVVRSELTGFTPNAGDACGRSIDIGDVDGNGHGDIVIGCDVDQIGATAGMGSAMVFVRDALNTGFLAAERLSRPTAVANSGCGRSVSVADVNGDGRDDVGMGCPTATTSTGLAVVFTRNAANTSFDAGLERAHAATATNDECGYGIEVVDLDRDGRSDLAMGCPADDDGASAAGTIQTFSTTSTGSAGVLARVVETRKLNRVNGTITGATIAQQHRANGAAAPTLQASADGGSTWESATWGAPVSFTEPGSDLRLRVTLPASSNPKFVEVLSSLSVNYDITSNAVPGTATLVTPAAAAHVTDDTPALTATFVDSDVADIGTLQFQVCTITVAPTETCTGQGGTLSATGSTGSSIASGANGTWSPSSALTADATYYWRVRGRDAANVWGPWSSSRSVIVDSVITVSAPGGTIALGAAALDADVTGSTSITVESNDPQGYQLVAADEDAAWGMQCTNVPQCGTAKIPDRTATGAAPLTWTAGNGGTSGYFGVTVLDTTGTSNDRLAKWGNANPAGWPANDVTNNLFAGLGTTTTVLHQVGSVAPSDTVVLGARLTPTSTGTPTPAGTYAGVITVTAVGL